MYGSRPVYQHQSPHGIPQREQPQKTQVPTLNAIESNNNNHQSLSQNPATQLSTASQLLSLSLSPQETPMHSWEAVAGARSIGPTVSHTSTFWAHCQPHKKWLLLPTPVPVSRSLFLSLKASIFSY